MAEVKLNGGSKMQEALKEIKRKLLNEPKLRVGFLENATYPDGTLVAMVAATQDFGSPENNIPPRPFFRNMVADKQSEWGPTLGQQLVANGYDADAALSVLGLGIKGQLQQSIRDTNEPPLKPATIKAKGFDKPLIDTGHMINSVDYQIIK